MACTTPSRITRTVNPTATTAIGPLLIRPFTTSSSQRYSVHRYRYSDHYHRYYHPSISTQPYRTNTTCLVPRYITSIYDHHHHHLSRSFAKKSKDKDTDSNTSQEPIKSLDDITFSWKTPSSLISDNNSVKSQRREAATEKARMKVERGRRREVTRLALLDQRRQALIDNKGDIRGINIQQEHLYTSLIPLMKQADYTNEETSVITQLGNYHIANSAELLKGRIQNIMKLYSKTPGDTGSSEVQIAVLTERLHTLKQHIDTYRSDIHSRRTYAIYYNRRRKLLKYLRKTNFLSYEMMMKNCHLHQQDIDTMGHTEKSGNQARRISRSG